MKIHRITGWLALILIFHAARTTLAELRTHGLFRDNAVLQRDAKVPVFGETKASEPVVVQFAGQKATATPKDGKWRVELAPMPASREPRAMTITQGDSKLELKNLLVGDVWVCGGQSNMFVPLRDTDGARQAIADAANDQLRLYFINPFFVDQDHPKEPRDWIDGKWDVSAPATVDGFTAVGYYFGRKLQTDTDVPIGLIESCLGGTSAERWTSRESMESNPELRDATEGQKYDLYNGMIAPLTQFPIRGVIWYQGESNAPRSWKYRTLLPALIKCWRDAWGQGDFPFLVVQLPGFEKIASEPTESDWADMREAQLYVSQTVPNVGLAVTTDLGDEREIHPRRKREVGERLALAALTRSYGRDVVDSGPIYDGMRIDGDKIVLRFKHVGQGLEAKGGSLNGFTVAGEDRKFYDAAAKIEGNNVIVSVKHVPRPVAVRFGWAKNPVVNLWNRDGLPASPFRTDAFPLPTQNNK
jgi:sialate O-acetylesterase